MGVESSLSASSRPRLHVVTFGSDDRPSTRHRFIAGLPYFQKHFDVTWARSLGDARLFELGGGDILLIQKRIPSPLWMLLSLWRLKCSVVFDFDDAIWVNGPRAGWSHRLRVGYSLPRLLRRADLVFAANQYLATWARRAGADPVVLPMSVEIPEAPLPARGAGPLVFGWGGHPQSHYLLRSVRDEFAAFFTGATDCRFVVMSGERPDLDFEFDWWPYSPETEARFFAEIDVGLVPGAHSEFDYGKTPIKVLQHFAAGRPVIASGAGGVEDLVSERTGWLVGEGLGWEAALRAARDDHAARLQKGEAARALVQARHGRSVVFEAATRELLRLAAAR